MRVNLPRIPAAFIVLSLGASACVVYTSSGQQQQPAAPPPPKPTQPAPAPPSTAAKPSKASPKPAMTVAPIRGPVISGLASGQMIEVDGKPVPTISKPVAFGDGKPSPGSILGLVYFLDENTQKLPDFSNLVPTAALYTKQFDIAPRKFEDGFPGVDGRYEFFAIKYAGQFEVKAPGEYEFRLVSDDGATVKVDNVLLIDNDGVHPPAEKRAKIRLLAGNHSIEVKYFQGPRYDVALQLFVTPPGGKEKLWSSSL